MTPTRGHTLRLQQGTLQHGAVLRWQTQRLHMRRQLERLLEYQECDVIVEIQLVEELVPQQTAQSGSLVGVRLPLALQVVFAGTRQQRVRAVVGHIVGAGQHQLGMNQCAAADVVRLHVHHGHHPGELGEVGVVLVVAVQLVVESIGIAEAAALVLELAQVASHGILALRELKRNHFIEY